MPSTQEHARRLARVQQNCRDAMEEYRGRRAAYRAARQETERCRESLAREERAGNSIARSDRRRRLREELRDAESNEQAAYGPARRARAALRQRQRDLREEERYLREMETLTRIPLPREIAEMISIHNYRGYFDDPDL